MREHPEQVPAWAPKLEPWQIVALGRFIGSTPAAEVYAENQAKTSRAVGIEYRLLKLPAAQ